jgi:hypothetical protein
MTTSSYTETKEGLRTYHKTALPWIRQSKCLLVTWEIIPLKLPEKAAFCSHRGIICDNRDQPTATQMAPMEMFCNKTAVRPNCTTHLSVSRQYKLQEI